jgi:predicted NBD/HSP70 family sugar kinase
VNDAALTASSPRRIRQRNEVAALQALHQSGPLTKADLARMLRVNRSSSGHIITALQADGLVREQEATAPDLRDRGRAGRPGTRIELVPEAVSFIGIEIGVEHLAVVEIDLAAKPVSANIVPFDGPAVAVEDAVRQAVDLALRTVPEERLRRCEGLGVATPAQMDRQGMVRSAPLLGWHNINLAETVKAALPLRVPIVAENDANAFAIGATYRHPAFRSGVTLFLVMESGVGGGIIIDGGLFRGGNGVAGEIGHLIVPDGKNRRALERVIGLENVLEQYGREAGAGSDLADFLAGVKAGSAAAIRIAHYWADTLAYGLVQVCRVIDADRIVLGGSLSALYPLVAERVRQSMLSLQNVSFPLPDIAVTDLEGSGPAFGAACILHQRYLSLESQRLSDATESVGSRS